MHTVEVSNDGVELEVAETTPAPEEAQELGFHPLHGCDVSKQRPIVGDRYMLKDSNPSYDLCEAEYMKLPAAEQVQYVCIPPPWKQSSIDALLPPVPRPVQSALKGNSRTMIPP